MRKVIILLLLVILAIFGYAYKLHTSQINLNVSLSPHCNYSNGSEALRIFLEGARYLYKVEEAPLNIVSPHNYLKNSVERLMKLSLDFTLTIHPIHARKRKTE